MTPPALDDSDGHPFHFARTAYRPTDEQDWRQGICKALAERHFFDLTHLCTVVPHHNGQVPIGDGVAAKS